MKNTFRGKKPAVQKSTSTMKKPGSVSPELHKLSKKEKLQLEKDTQKLFETQLNQLQDGLTRHGEALAKLETTKASSESLSQLQSEHNELTKLVEKLAQQQKSTSLAMREQATIQEALTRSDVMYDRVIHIMRAMEENSEKSEQNASSILETVLETMEEIRQHIRVLVDLKTEIDLKPETIQRIVEPVADEMKRHTDSKVESTLQSLKKTTSQTLSQSFSDLAGHLEEVSQRSEEQTQRQEAAAERTEEMVQRLEQLIAEQEKARNWQHQALRLIGAIGLQAATLILAALVILGPVAVGLRLINAPGYLQWLVDFGSQSVGHGLIAGLLGLISLVVAVVLLVVGYHMLSTALEEQPGKEKLMELKEIPSLLRLNKAFRTGGTAGYYEEIKQQAIKERDAAKQQEEDN